MIAEILTVSHAFVVPTLCRMWEREKFPEFYAMLLSAGLSIMMHLSETKHGLMPLTEFLRKNSELYLNLDRWGAYLAFGLILARNYQRLNMDHINLFLAALFMLGIGEAVDVGVYREPNQRPHYWLLKQQVYLISHLVWHLCVFLLLPMSII
jgi:hypothetical protein